mmetsp:Transcript_14022/g.16098  ORF Transcript_14022/g.16098 Transcript_14022/m.16098 type:complete len:423 (-) Transcript_14022:308-1576(-)
MLRITTLIILFSPVSAIIACFPKLQALDACHSQKEGCEDCRIIGGPSNPFFAGFCTVANDVLCNAMGCCEECEDEFNEYETCLNEATFFNCDLGDCENTPTPAPSPSPTTAAPSPIAQFEENLLGEEMESQGCLEKFGNFAQCAAQNPLLCGRCFVEGIPDDISGGGLCGIANEAICGFGNCCQPCTDEFVEFDNCFETIVEDVTFGSCEINCDDYEPPADQVQPLDPTCIDKLSNYTDCVAANPQECITCGVINFPTLPGQDDDFCGVATDSVCGFSRCCSSCDAQFQEFDECFESWVSVATFGQCEIDCDTYEDDGNENTLGECGTALESYTTCVQENPLQCAICVIQNFPNPDKGFCENAEDSLCGLGECCTPCTTEFSGFEDCLQTVSSTVSLGQCAINCPFNDGPGKRGLRGIDQAR